MRLVPAFKCIALTTGLTLATSGCDLVPLVGMKLKSNSEATFEVSPPEKTVLIGDAVDVSMNVDPTTLELEIVDGDATLTVTSDGVRVLPNSVGTVILRARDPNGLTRYVQVTVNPPMSLAKTEHDVFSFSGSSFPLPTPTGGLPDFIYSLISGTGAIAENRLNPTGAAGSSVVRLRDQSNTTLDLTLYQRSMNNRASVESPAAPIISNLIPTDGVDFGADFVTISNLLPNNYENGYFGAAKPRSVAIHKTADNGENWTTVGQYQHRGDRSTYGRTLLKSGSTLYLVGYSQIYFLSASANERYEGVVARSTDGGATWETILTYYNSNPSYESTSFMDGVLTDDNALVIVGFSSSPGSSVRETFIRRCNLTTRACTNVYSSTRSTSPTEIDNIERDTAGMLYAAERLYDEGFGAYRLHLKKSTDHGVTWTTSLIGDGDDIATFNVTADGQTMIAAGAVWVSPPVSHITRDGGANWTRIVGTANTCPGRGFVSVKIDEGTGDALGVCFNYSVGGFTTYIERLPNGATSWANLITISNEEPGRLLQKNDGTVFLSQINTFRVTLNFGTNFSTVTRPTFSNRPDLNLFDFIQTGSDSLRAVGIELNATWSQKQGVIYSSTDRGFTWAPLQKLVSTSSVLSSLARSPTTETEIAVGTQGLGWLTYRKTSDGPSFSLVSTDVLESTAWGATVTKVLCSPAGVFYSLGWHRGAAAFPWVVRQSTDDGLTWTSVDLQGLGGTIVRSGFFDGEDLIVVGSNNSEWAVRRWDGATWTEEDTFSIAPTTGSQLVATAGARLSDGTLIVVGEYTRTNGYRAWTVREKKASSGAWSTADTFSPAANQHASPVAIAELDGNLVVSGFIENATGQVGAGMRVRYGTSWQTADHLAGPGITSPYAMKNCFENHLCLIGSVANSTWGVQSVFRVLSDR